MSDNIIKFSFLKTTIQEFEFLVYRKSKDDENKLEDTYEYNLPLSEVNLNIRDRYLVSFVKRDGFTEFKCKSSYNPYLTKKWMMEVLITQVKDKLDKDSFWIGTHFTPNVSFIVKHYMEGDQIVTLESYYLIEKKSFGFIIDFKFVPQNGYEKTQIEKIYSLSLTRNGEKNKNFYIDKYSIIYDFINHILVKIFPIKSSLFDLDVERTLCKLPCKYLKEKTYVFGGNNNYKIQFQGLKNFGPLYSISKEPLFIFIFEKSKVNISRELVRGLRGQIYSTFPGMKKMFGVNFNNENIKAIQINKYDSDSLKQIEIELDKYINQFPKHQIVGIFSGISRDFDTNKSYSPYYSVKNMFLKRGLAVQAVTIDQALKKDGFKWSISGIALQLFVKLGGHPWKVIPQNNDCIIFGISSAHVKDKNNKIKKYFAYSVCFDSSGIYKQLDILSSDSDEDTYIRKLSEQIPIQLSDKLHNNIKKCVIHVPFKLKKNEMNCIRESINRLKAQVKDIEFIFIKINTNNKYFGYSNFNSKIPLAGSYINLSENEFLVWFEGLQHGKETVVSASNISNPVHIQFMDTYDLSEKSINDYLQDVINLSGTNWRGFNAKHTPVSIYYPELIAKFIGKFDQYGLDINLGISAIDKAWFV